MQSGKAKFYTMKMYECTRDNKAHFRVMDVLMKRKAAPKLPNLSVSSSQSVDIRRQLASRRLQTVYILDGLCEQLCTISAFSWITLDDVHPLVRKVPTQPGVLDLLPTSLVKANIDIIAAALTSLETGAVPVNFKHEVITPLLKKSNHDSDSIKNNDQYQTDHLCQSYWECHVAIHLHQHLYIINILDAFQSACRQYHSTETAVVHIQNDLLRSIDREKGVVVWLLDMSTAFDSVGNSTLISIIGIQGITLQWLVSYMYKYKYIRQYALVATTPGGHWLNMSSTRVWVGPNYVFHLHFVLGGHHQET